MLRKEFGLDTAQAVLGHAKAEMTEHYARKMLDQAVTAMEQVG
jgi:integrase